MADAGETRRFVWYPSAELTISFCSPIPGFFKGTSADQDRRFSDKEIKLLKSMKFPPEFDKKVHRVRLGYICNVLSGVLGRYA